MDSPPLRRWSSPVAVWLLYVTQGLAAQQSSAGRPAPVDAPASGLQIQSVALAADSECGGDAEARDDNCAAYALQRQSRRLLNAAVAEGGGEASINEYAQANSTASCTASYTQNCKQSPVCCDPATRCYEKSGPVAVCLNSCAPGVHMNDQPQYRTPWTCNVIGGGGGGNAAPAPAPHAGGGGAACTEAYTHNCMHSPVCCDPAKKCYEKDHAVAICLDDCAAGVHSNDPPQYQTPWTCRLVSAGGSGGGGGPAPAPAPQPVPQPAPAPAPTQSPGPATPPTGEPSSGDLFEFFMYRGQNDQNFDLENVNAANLEGAMWYLQNEVVSGVYGSGNKFGITRIRRFKVMVRATQKLLDKGMNFGVRVAFDSGACTGPNCDYDWATFGFNVGCNNLGDFPFPKYNTHYGGGIWYSLPGPCPSESYLSKSDECVQREPGGRCEGTPTGAPGCTWSYEDAGEIQLEALYNETANQAAFWAEPDVDVRNSAKVSVARRLFGDLYGEDPPVPPCDFNYDNFYR